MAMFEPSKNKVLFHIVYSPINFLWAGSSAVKLFFVLSGFVLSIPFFSKDISKYTFLSYSIKRFLRIYLPTAAIITLGLIVKHSLYDFSAATNFGFAAKHFMGESFVGEEILNVYRLLHPYLNLNPSLWTMPIEIKLSILIPLYVYILKRVNFWASLVLLFSQFILYKIGLVIGIAKIYPEYATLYYFPLFLTGSLLCKYRVVIVEWINKKGNLFFFTLLIVAVLIYTIKYSMWWLPDYVLKLVWKFEEYIGIIPSTILMILALSKKAEPMLSKKYLTFIGKISFSLYLVHHTTLLCSIYLFGKVFIQPVVIFIGIAMCFPIAYLFYIWIEQPSLKLAKKTSDLALKLFQTRN
jgi:peptidoglycan/LPS O-acetylase OafA/YrhL